MKIDTINVKENKQINKNLLKGYLFFGLLSLIFVSSIILIILFHDRSLMNLFVFLLTIISTVYFIIVLFLFFMNINPLNRYKKLIKKCNENIGKLVVFENVLIVEERELPYTYLGIETKEYTGKNNDLEINYKFFINYKNDNKFIVNHRYKLYTYKNYIVQYEELD